MSYGRTHFHPFYGHLHGHLLDFTLLSYAILIRVALKIGCRVSAIRMLLPAGFDLKTRAFDLSHQKFLSFSEFFFCVVDLIFLQFLCYLHGLSSALGLVHLINYLHSKATDFQGLVLCHQSFHIFYRLWGFHIRFPCDWICH